MISGDLSHAFEGWLPRGLPIGPLLATVVASNWMHGRPSVSSPCHCLAKAIFKAISGVTSVTLGWSVFFWGTSFFRSDIEGNNQNQQNIGFLWTSEGCWRKLHLVQSYLNLSLKGVLLQAPAKTLPNWSETKKTGPTPALSISWARRCPSLFEMQFLVRSVEFHH